MKPVAMALILCLAMADDLYERRFRNSLFIVALAGGLFLNVLTDGTYSIHLIFFNILVALALGMPLYAAKIMGGGDVKLFLVMGLFMKWQAEPAVLFFALVWGSLLGI